MGIEDVLVCGVTGICGICDEVAFGFLSSSFVLEELLLLPVLVESSLSFDLPLIDVLQLVAVALLCYLVSVFYCCRSWLCFG